MYRIEAQRHVATLPGVAVPLDALMLQNQITALASELRELRSNNDRLRLTLRLREDRIRELEQSVREHRERAAARDAELARITVQPAPDDLKRIPGIGPGFERALHAAGITSFRQIAAWTPSDVERIAREIHTAPSRIVRARWVEHARTLAG